MRDTKGHTLSQKACVRRLKKLFYNNLRLMKMESIAASVPQSLVESLDFRLASTAAGVSQRVQTTFSPSGGSSYNAKAGTRIIRFNLTSEDWLDGESCRLQFDVRNITTDPLLFTTLVPSCLFSRLLVRGAGNTIEDVVDY